MRKSTASSADIHPTAIVHPDAQIGPHVSIGPYVVIGPRVHIGEGSEIMDHVSIAGETYLGACNRVFPFASVGQDPQDKKYQGETPSRLEMGDHNVVREYVTLNRGTAQGGGVTRIGSHNLFMAYCHVAHDCEVGDHTIFANCATLGGHVHIGDAVYLGGFTAVHQFCTIGRNTMTGGHTMIAQDVPPYVIASGNRARLYGINRIGLERSGFPPEEIQALQQAYKRFFRGKVGAEEALAELESAYAHSPHVMNLVRFIRASERGICR